MANLDPVLAEIQAENQAELPEEDRMGQGEFCGHLHDGWSCTKDAHHPGDHIAHGMLGTILQRWPKEQDDRDFDVGGEG